MKNRDCGGCTVCCEILEIPTLEKPSRKMCSNVCDTGCGIYNERPSECAQFQCVWSEGYTGEGQRPDKSGIMAYYIDHPELGRTLLVLEVKPKAFIKRSKQRDRLIKMANERRSAVIISDHEGKSFAMVP